MDLENEFDRPRKSGNSGLLHWFADEEPSVSQHAGIHADAIDGAITIVVERALDAETESREAGRKRSALSFEPAAFYA